MQYSFLKCSLNDTINGQRVLINIKNLKSNAHFLFNFNNKSFPVVFTEIFSPWCNSTKYGIPGKRSKQLSL